MARYARGARALLQLSLGTNLVETKAISNSFKQPYFEDENMLLAVLGTENAEYF